MLRGKLAQVDGDTAIVTLGAGRVSVAAASLRALGIGSAVDLFVRPEQLRIAAAGDPAAIIATVTSHVYQGGHVDVHATSPDAIGRVLVRVPGEAALQAPVGAQVGIAPPASGAVAFPVEKA